MFTQFSMAEKLTLSKLDSFGYVFEWTKNSSEKALTVGKISNGDIAGLI